MIAVLLLGAALAAAPCPHLAQGDQVPAGVVVAGRLACDGVVAPTAAVAARAQELALVQADLEHARAAQARLEGEVAALTAERDAEHVARVAAEAALAAHQAAPRPRPLPQAVQVGGGVLLGLGACWLAPGAHQ